MDSYHQESEEWRKLMDENLMKEDSWLALAGLFWLDEGENSFGTDSSNSIVLPSVPGGGRIGKFYLKNNQVTLYVEESIDIKVNGKSVKESLLKSDASGSPTEIKLHNLTFMLIEREDGLGIRLWDNSRPKRKTFPGRVWFPIDENYLVQGSYEPYQEDLDLVMKRKNGSDLKDQAQGQLNFQLVGRDHKLIAFKQENGSLFTLFLDQTSGKECYPAGRYLVVDPPQGDSIEIDFNRAYNPPCAFTNFATCPLPPPQNRLDEAILAGEKL